MSNTHNVSAPRQHGPGVQQHEPEQDELGVLQGRRIPSWRRVDPQKTAPPFFGGLQSWRSFWQVTIYCEMPGMSRWEEFSDLGKPGLGRLLLFFCEREGKCDTQIEKTICWLQACPWSAVPKCYFRVGNCAIQSYDSRCLQCFVCHFRRNSFL